jgi:hypothetical protein
MGQSYNQTVLPERVFMNKAQIFLRVLTEDRYFRDVPPTDLVGNDVPGQSNGEEPVDTENTDLLTKKDKSQTTLQKFLNPTTYDKEQSAEIEKFRLKKQLRYMKKFYSDPDKPKSIGQSQDRQFYWDANVNRIYGG